MGTTTPGPDALTDAEHALQQALRDADVAVLERLLHPEVHYVGPDGVVADRDTDLEAHRSGVLRLTGVEERALDARTFGTTGVTRATLALVGTHAGAPIDVTLVYTRTWTALDDAWVVVAAHASVAP